MSSVRERARRQKLIIATHNVRMLAVDGKHGVGRSAEALEIYLEMGFDHRSAGESGEAANLHCMYVLSSQIADWASTGMVANSARGSA